jgi:WD40 repeat protein
VVGTSSGSVLYISWSDLSKVKLISGHSGEICGIAFTKDGTHFATCSVDGLLAVWSVETMEQTVAFQAPKKSCTCLAFAPQQARGCIGDNEQERGQLSPSSGSTCIPDIVAGYSDGTVRIFDATGVKMVRKMQPHATTVKAVMYSFDGK